MKNKLAIVTGGVVATLALAFFTAAILLKSDWGEERVRQLIEEGSQEAMSGRILVGEVSDIEVLSPPGIVRGTLASVSVQGPGGEEVLGISKLMLELDVFALFGGVVRCRHAAIDVAHIPVDPDTGRPRLAGGFAQRTVFRPRSMDLRIEDVQIDHLKLVAIQAAGAPKSLGWISGKIDVFAARDEPGAKIVLHGMKGATTSGTYGAIKITDATGYVETHAEKAADVHFDAKVEGASAMGRVQYYPNDRDNPVRLTLMDMGAGLPPSMLGAGMPTGGSMGGVPGEMFKGFIPTESMITPEMRERLQNRRP